MYNKEITLRKGLNEGYLYFCDKDHPLSRGNSGMVLYHRHVASLSIGRWVSSDEVVHHKDENRLNNSPSNLEVLSRSEHSRIHAGVYLVDIICPICKNLFRPRTSGQLYCSTKCAASSRVIIQISKEMLERDIWYYPYTSLTHKYGLSDVGLKKRAKSLGCKIPPPYFHSKTDGYKASLREENNIK